MLFNKKLVFPIENKETGIRLISEKCNFVNVLIGIYFICDYSKATFDAKYRSEQLLLYYRDIRMVFFNPLIILTFFDNYVEVKIKYNKINTVVLCLLELLFLIFGIIGTVNSGNIIFSLPFILFSLFIIISFNISSKIIIKELKKIYDNEDEL